MTDSPLDPDFIAAQRARLERSRDDLLTGEREATDIVRDATEERRTTPQDLQDAAQGEIQEQFREALHGVNESRLADIARALQKIDEGTYGLSDESDEPIPRARLEAVPEAVLTVEEAERRAQRARTTGPR